MAQPGYLIPIFVVAVLGGLIWILSAIYFWKKRANFILQTRSPHLLGFTLICTMLLTIVWAAEEARFTLFGNGISPYIIAAVSHLVVPWTILPLLFRATAFHIMFDVGLRKKYVRFIRRKMSLLIMLILTILTAAVPYVIHIYVQPSYFRGEAFGSNLLFGAWKYFICVFVVSIILQAAQLWQLTHVKKLEDTLGLINELKVVLISTILFVVTYFTWLICLDNGVRASSLTVYENTAWMRLNWIPLIFQFTICGHVLLRQLNAVFQHTRNTLKTAAMYATPAAQSKWMHPRGQVVSKVKVPGLTGLAGHHQSKDSDEKTPSMNRQGSNQTTAGSGSRDNSPRQSWAGRYSPKVSRHNSPRGSTNWAAGISSAAESGGVTLFSHSPKLGPRQMSPGHPRNTSDPTSSSDNTNEPRLKSLHDILRHDIGRELFAEFAARHLTLESVLFYEAVESFENHPAWNGLELRPVYDLGVQIYASFISTGSEYEVNIDSRLKRQLKKIFASSTGRDSGQAGGQAGGNKKKKSKPSVDQSGAGTGTGTAAQAAKNATNAAAQQPAGRFEAFLSIPASQRRELYRPAQDEVYSLLKVNLYLPFYHSPEFTNLRRAFEKDLAVRKAQAQAQAAQAAPVGAGTGVPTSTDAPSTPQFLRTPSQAASRRVTMGMSLGIGIAGGNSLPPSQNPSPGGSPSLNPSRNVHLRLEHSPLHGARSRRTSSTPTQEAMQYGLQQYNATHSGGGIGDISLGQGITSAPTSGLARTMNLAERGDPDQSPSILDLSPSESLTPTTSHSLYPLAMQLHEVSSSSPISPSTHQKVTFHVSGPPEIKRITSGASTSGILSTATTTEVTVLEPAIPSSPIDTTNSSGAAASTTQ